MLPYRVDGAPDARPLTDRDIDADDVARLLIDDRVDGDRGLADGAVADDQFALAAAEREQRIDDQEPVCTGWIRDRGR